MDCRYDDDNLEQLYTDARFTAGFPPAIVKMYRKRVQMIRAAQDERDLRQLKSAHFEKLKGKRKHQHSLRLNERYRLIIEIEGKAPNKTIVIVEIEDYH